MISILGAGAVGQLLAHKLTEASIDCQLIVRAENNARSSLWCLHDQEQQIYHEIPPITASECDELGQVWLCVKSHQLETALESISHAISDTTKIVLFQNGMGHEQIALRFVNPVQIYFASNTHGAFTSETNTVHYAGRGSVTFGSFHTTEPSDFLSSNVLEAVNGQWHSDIKTVLWQKLFINAVINPLTAIYQCKNGALLDHDKKPAVLALINENQRLADILDLNFEQAIKDITLKVIQATAANNSSMLQDIQQGNITEINAINGYLLDQAAKIGAQVPHNWQLWSQFHIAHPPLKSVAQQRAKELDTLSYQVTQQHGTEPPFSGAYNLHQEKGIYHCVCCESPLFRHDSKFDAGCGWPSFDRAQDNKAIAYKQDHSHGMTRTEILCAQCGSHLGHVFDDGPTVTGQRFCVNSVSLNFKQDDS
ncbi:peptide-methionine (R)-S-oxide reductase MsrB [Kangiella spongicola]|uniref:2-dehydropantoate 2-reductase n=1 Tax=Kangiella spongicola TaxID=796379 RepID=A0A318DA81_9GAMM|nr:peptide-methionine (R)-S-oxide reductase MsrB [Kangiella spongicola]PXF63817.1 peptide-methionine (R)-S-oxide reductase [Kangiella spongicola]